LTDRSGAPKYFFVSRRANKPIGACWKRLAEHINALELLAEVVRDLPEDDERLLML
jgi:hypothetical protein